MTTDPWAHVQAPQQAAAAKEQVSYEFAIRTGAGVLITERSTLGSDETEPFTAETAAHDAATYRGAVQRREVRRGPWQAAPTTPTASTRTRRSPASPGQKKFVDDLLRDRVVPEALRRRAAACRETMSDEDARELIPLLKDCPKHDSGYDDPYDMPDYNPGLQEHDV